MHRFNRFNLDRIIGTYTTGLAGPLLIVIGGMHGNEPAGVLALEQLFGLLELESKKNPAVEFRGKLIGIRGNIAALKKNERFIKRDLNRSWIPSHLEQIKSQEASLDAEDKELIELLNCLETFLASSSDQICVLDIHTTTAHGGIFSIPNGSTKSLELAKAMHAPVVLGMIEGIRGTSLHYFNQANLGDKMTSVVFEAGQHDEPLAVDRSISAIISCLRELGCIRSSDVESKHEAILKTYAKGLPTITQLIYTHSISPDDQFVMEPGFLNFQTIESGTVLARDINGPVIAQESGMILMPLYQKQGEDGFFLVRPVEY